MEPIHDLLKRCNVKGQRFLIITSLFPPDVLGGAEMSAADLAHWLQKQGADVGVLTAAKIPEEAHDCRIIDGLKIWRVWIPRAYSMFYASKARQWQKPLWHLQDHLDPRNQSIAAKVLDEFKPDYVNAHVLQGIGYNILREIGKRGIPTTYTLHDLSLACFRMGMYRKGKNCAGQCFACSLSSACKLAYVKKVPKLNFISPSRANLENLAQYFPVKRWFNAVISNVNRYPPPTVVDAPRTVFRILYVGRLQKSKGIDVLLNAARSLAEHYKFELLVIGRGAEEEALRQAFEAFPWCKFTGFITHQVISNFMAESDVLCVPSVWAENSPGVAIHALSMGLPVVGSNIGGIPELVQHEVNGLLVAPGNVAAWQAALKRILDNPAQLRAWRAHALSNTYKFDQDYLGVKTVEVIQNAATAGYSRRPQ